MIGTPSFSQRSTASALVMPNSFANSCTRMFFATAQVSLSLSSTLSHGPHFHSDRHSCAHSDHHVGHRCRVQQKPSAGHLPPKPVPNIATPDQIHASAALHLGIEAHTATHRDHLQPYRLWPRHLRLVRNGSQGCAVAQTGTRHRSAEVGAGQSSSPAPPSAVIGSDPSESVTTSSAAISTTSASL